MRHPLPLLIPLLALPALLAACGNHKGHDGPSPSACKVLRVTPEASVTAGFIDPLMTVVYTAPSANACEFKLVDQAQATVATTTVASSEWVLPGGGFSGTRTIVADRALQPSTRYGLQLDGQTVSFFATGQQRRGSLEGAVEDLTVQYGSLPKSSRIEKDQINQLLDVLVHDYAKGDPIVEALLRPLLREELPHFAAPGATYSAQVKRVRYRGSDAAGAPLTLSGLLVLPVRAPGGPAVDYNGLPIVIGQRGAETNDAPAPSSGRNAMLLIGLAAAGKGHVYFAPDLIGKGDSSASTQAFLIGSDTAAQTDDMLTAVNEHFMQTERARLGIDLRLVGLSQGAFSAVSALPLLSRHTTIRLVSTGDGPFDIRRTLDAALRVAAGEPRDAYSAHVDTGRIPTFLRGVLDALRAYQRLSFDPAKIFQADGKTPLPAFLADYRAGKYAHWAPHLAVNSPASGTQRYALPLAEFRLYHFSKDTLIAEQNTLDMMAMLKGGGVPANAVERGSCKEKSVLVEALLKISRSKTLPHTICLPFQLDDFIGRL